MPNIDTGSTPSLIAAIAMPARVCVCMTTWFSSERVMWIAEWITKPA